MWPTPPVFSTASRAARRTPSSGAEEDARVDVALQRDAWSNLLAHRRQVHAPIDAQHSRARFGRRREQMARCFGVQDDGRVACANFFDQKLRGGQREFAVLVERKFTHPRIE